MPEIQYEITCIYNDDVLLPNGDWITRHEYFLRTGYPVRVPEWRWPSACSVTFGAEHER